MLLSGKSYLRETLSTVDLLVVTGYYKLLFKLELFPFFLQSKLP